MAPSMRWKRLISPHGTPQLPKSVCSRSDASASARSLRLGAGASRHVVVDRQRLGVRRRRATSSHSASPQNTASEVGIECDAPAVVPVAQQRDRPGEPRLQRIAARQRVVVGDQDRDQLREGGQVGIEGRRDQRRQGEVLARRRARAIACSAARVLADAVHVAREVGALRAVGAGRRIRPVVGVEQPAVGRVHARAAASSSACRPCQSVAGSLPSTGLV